MNTYSDLKDQLRITKEQLRLANIKNDKLIKAYEKLLKFVKDSKGKYQATLCWDCENSVPVLDNATGEYTRGCAWSINEKPVKNWVAEKTWLDNSTGEIPKGCVSYCVKSCPKFSKWERLQ